ncbi:TPA: ATP-binding cassette domain-containing protein, partial [Streptococcus suis]
FLRGKKYAIMGESGCGKSTLLKVLLGEIDQYKGDVLINGKPKDKTSNLFDKIAYVNQETFLLNDTLKNNIDLDSKMTDEEVAILLEKLGLSNFDAQMKIEENGKNLSGGQRQRLALARALARGKDILVLDEATANLDEQTTKLIYDIVLANEATVIMITHHLDSETAKRFDEIIKL